jgi:hypothetical protein
LVGLGRRWVRWQRQDSSNYRNSSAATVIYRTEAPPAIGRAGTNKTTKLVS